MGPANLIWEHAICLFNDILLAKRLMQTKLEKPAGFRKNNREERTLGLAPHPATTEIEKLRKREKERERERGEMREREGERDT